jgi:hypothetical protein
MIIKGIRRRFFAPLRMTAARMTCIAANRTSNTGKFV